MGMMGTAPTLEALAKTLTGTGTALGRTLILKPEDVSTEYGLIERHQGTITMESLFHHMDLLSAYTLKNYVGGNDHILTAHAEADFYKSIPADTTLKMIAMPLASGKSSMEMGLEIYAEKWWGWKRVASAYLTFAVRDEAWDPVKIQQLKPATYVQKMLRDRVLQRKDARVLERVRLDAETESSSIYQQTSMLAVPESAKNLHGVAGGGYLTDVAYSQAIAAVRAHYSDAAQLELAAINSVSFEKPVHLGTDVRYETSVQYVHGNHAVVQVTLSTEEREKFQKNAQMAFTLRTYDHTHNPLLLGDAGSPLGRKRYEQWMQRKAA